MLYRYETHCHSSQCSRCAHSSAQELVQAYHAAGYAGLVLTDHFILGNTCVDDTLPWPERMARYYGAFLDAQEAARELDFDVIFGIEHAFGDGREYLCYGIDLDFLNANADLPNLPPEVFNHRVQAAGGLVIQAHPFRYCGPEVPLQPELFDGIEVYNASNHPNGNRDAAQCAPAGTILTSGGDIHWAGDAKIGMAGIILPYRIRDGHELVAALKRRDHQCIIDGCSPSFSVD